VIGSPRSVVEPAGRAELRLQIRSVSSPEGGRQGLKLETLNTHTHTHTHAHAHTHPHYTIDRLLINY